jgi:hypothetical protein
MLGSLPERCHGAGEGKRRTIIFHAKEWRESKL